MGYFSALADGAFKENPDGEGWLYYPNGIISKGRLVASEETKKKLHNFQKRMYMFGLPFGAIYGLSLDLDNVNYYSFLVPAVILLLVIIRQQFLIKNLPVSTIKLGYKESVSAGLKGLPVWYIYLLYVLSFSVFICGIYFYLEKSDSYVGLIFIGTSVVSAALGVLTQKMKKI
jgi:hypothetical protein